LDSHLKSDVFGALIGTKSLLVKHPEVIIKAISYTAGIEAVKKARENNSISQKKEEKRKDS
jgi:hypothetical protein